MSKKQTTNHSPRKIPHVKNIHPQGQEHLVKLEGNFIRLIRHQSDQESKISKGSGKGKNGMNLGKHTKG